MRPAVAATSAGGVRARLRVMTDLGCGLLLTGVDLGPRKGRMSATLAIALYDLRRGVLAGELAETVDRLYGRDRCRRMIARRYAEALSTTSIGMAQGGGDDYVAHLVVIRTLRAEVVVGAPAMAANSATRQRAAESPAGALY